MRLYLPILLVLIFCAPSFLAGQADVPGSEDHPLLTRYPGSHIAWYATEKYFEYDLATGPLTGYRRIGEREKHAGQLYRVYYEVPGTPEEVSIGEVYADYLRAFEKAGITVLNKALRPKANEFGGSQWLGTALAGQAPKQSAASKLFAGTASSGGKFALMGRVDRPTGPVFVAIYGERHSNKLVNFLVDILETKDAELGKVSLNPDYLGSELDARGSVSIYGIEFDFDSAKLKPESDKVIGEIAAFLGARPQVQLFVVGHTDMTGSLEYNRKLSQDRARAVVARLETNFNVARGRLEPDGVAFLAPKAGNTTEDGRLLNRRVELVLRK
jgi:outer membrane protein OmpA-like peptidoglycan-associated protein